MERQITITKKNMPNIKFPKVLCSCAILYNEITLKTFSYKKNQQIMILPLTKNSAEMFRDYLKEETLKKKEPQKTNSHKISQIFHWNSRFTNLLIKGNNLNVKGARLHLRSAPIFTEKWRHGKRVITFDSPHILAYLESDIKNFSTKLKYFIKFTCWKIYSPSKLLDKLWDV